MTDESKFAVLIDELLKERKADRKARVLRTALIALPAIVIALGVFLGAVSGAGSSKQDADKHVALVRMSGEIMPENKLSAEKINPALVEAFKDDEAKGIVLLINSPGGTPVQASLIHDRIKALKAEYPKKKVIAVGEDMVTSGAYMIAVSADKIVVNRSTVTGSIGVISRNFGFQGTMEKLGVERRTMTSGKSKNRLDPFGPFTDEDQFKLKELLNKIHVHFIDTVKDSRKGKLKGADDLLFSGDFWTGEEALALGLVDEISDLPSILKKEFDVKVFKDYTKKDSVLDTLSKGFLTRTMEDFGLIPRSEVVLALPK